MDTIIYSQYFSVRRFNLCGAQHTPKELAWYATSRNRDLDFGNHLSDGDVKPSRRIRLIGFNFRFLDLPLSPFEDKEPFVVDSCCGADLAGFQRQV